MQINVNIKYKDLVLISILLFPRLRSNWILLGIFTICIFLFIYFQKVHYTSTDYIITLLASVIGSIVGILSTLFFNIIIMLLSINKRSGILGEHNYTITKEGLHEITTVNESTQKWSGVKSIKMINNYIYFHIYANLFHIIPGRFFTDKNHFKQFYNEALQLKNSAKKQENQ